ncbi:MAG: bifunctional DNA-binding transcriptional regulator/O6-methylguanine-DNA methyltransferase Ada [Gemmatimonadetes bacterium]|nr:bifunctional DNA-binding transcriptional regulator/O6-methylguanine-DNA methyltransferase Ada [Gemmatimonadota bacterium]
MSASSTRTEPPAVASPDAPVPLDPEEAWAAVLARDPSYDGRFFFAVATTGVYCRPGCAARRPRRENVRFFATAAEAQAAGFRACKRCRPNEDRPSAARASVERARAYLEEHLDENVTLERLARAACMSAFHLQRTFKRHIGLTPRQYVEARRAERLKARLRAGDTVSRATFEAGYGSASRVYEQAAAHLGMTPGAYRKGGPGMRIRFTTAATTLGCILVAATERGLCSVTLGDDVASLEEDLRREYPRADIQPGGDQLRAWVEAIVAYVEGSARDLSIPLDVQATRFQLRVWRALQEIPYGSTRSYRDVAEAIGQPTAARAVARACATNRVALVIPCHRVVHADGDPRGYRWGSERKRRLLEMEAAAAEA